MKREARRRGFGYDHVAEMSRRSTRSTKAPPTPAGGHTLDSWIAAKNLGKYEAQLLDLAGDLHDLVEMTDDDAAELIAECKMPKLAARRFKKALIELGASVAP